MQSADRQIEKWDKRKMTVSTRYWIITGIYMVVIFINSSIPGQSLPKIPISDKIQHMFEFGFLSWLLGKAFRTSQKEIFIKQSAILAIIITIFYGISDELHQAFIPGRYPEVDDVVFDGIGAVLAQGIKNRKGQRHKGTKEERKSTD